MTATDAAWFDPKNADQAAAWNGAEGRRWTENADRYDAACAAFDRWLLDAVKIGPNEAVLDIGCGAGISTRHAARAAAGGRVLGLDLSEPLLALARARAAEDQLSNVRFERADAQVVELERRSFDVVISRFGCMFFADPGAAFRNIAGALRPRGRLGLLTWRGLADNDWVRVIREALAAGRTLPDRQPGAPGQFGMADPDAVRALLDAAGFERIAHQAVDEPVVLGRSAEDAFAYVRRMGLALALLDGLDDDTRARALADLAARLAAKATPDGVRLRGGAWLITATRP